MTKISENGNGKTYIRSEGKTTENSPNWEKAADLVRWTIKNNMPLHSVDAILFTLGYTCGLRGQYWLEYRESNKWSEETMELARKALENPVDFTKTTPEEWAANLLKDDDPASPDYWR